VQRRRDEQAAKKFFLKLKACQYVARVIATDKLQSHRAIRREFLPRVAYRQHQYVHNRAGNSHQPTHQRERRI
jgi:putative transposase